MDGNKQNVPPTPDEIEISVFGPGYGESILLHLGENQWVLVDSCVNSQSGQPAPLEYLKHIQVDPSKSVKMIIATHWHDDHIRGLGDIFNACHSAEFVCSDALGIKELIALSKLYKAGSMMRSSGIKEFTTIFEALEERKIQPKFALADRCLWEDKINQSTDFSIYSLSPSDANILATKKELLKLLPAELSPKLRLPSPSPNQTAVAIWVTIKEFSILLGSDLEETGVNGWSTILETHFNSTSTLYGRASFIKIPHHGSKNAHHPRVWKKMLLSKPFAVLTPFSRGNVHLPTSEDAQRILTYTDQSYSTAIAGRQPKRKREHTVEKTIRETVRYIRQVNPATGQVRFRMKPKQPYSVELFGGALHLKELYTP